MKKILIFIIALVALQGMAVAQESGFGLGVILGQPTGLSGKYWTSGQNAIDGGLAWSFKDPGYFHIHADYLWHWPIRTGSPQRLNWYAGIGGRIGFAEHDPLIGVRIPVGLAWIPADTPLDVFLEVAPVLDLTPETDFDMMGGVGLRFFFR